MQGHQQQGSAPFPYGSAAVPIQQLQPGGQAPAQLVNPPLPHEDRSELVGQHSCAAAAFVGIQGPALSSSVPAEPPHH